MKKSLTYILPLFGLVLMISSCSSDFEATVDERVVPYLETFAQEAALRGIEFDNEKEMIVVSLGAEGSGASGDVLGRCNLSSVRNPIRTINLNETFWESATELEREYLVYHELGHCFLDRFHPMPPPVDAQGNCLSIMSAGTANCLGIQVYSEDKREALLDELFSN